MPLSIALPISLNLMSHTHILSLHLPPLSLGASASWRGARDPSLQVAADAEQRRDLNKSREGTRRDEFSGMGGMKRTR
jgi:hypothetical protein